MSPDDQPRNPLAPDLRAQLLAEPDLILQDRDLMRALVETHETEQGANVVDIRGRAMASLEARLDRLESQHQTVISAAYENQSSVATIHRAVLALLEPQELDGFLDNLGNRMAEILRVDTMVLLVEADIAGPLAAAGAPVRIVADGTIEQALSAGRRGLRGEDIVLRRLARETAPFHSREVGSEALLPLNLGNGRAQALLLMGACDDQRFTPAQGTDLLRFLAQVVRLVLIGHLST